MAGRNPDLRVHQDGAVQADVVGVLLNKALPPGALDVVFQLHTQRAIVPGVGKTAVNFGTGKNEASAFAQGDDFFHRFLGIVHLESFLLTKNLVKSSVCFSRI